MTDAPLLSTRLRVVVLAAHALLLVALPVLGRVLGALLALPLLAPLRGLWLGWPYTYAWSSMLLVFYVGAFVMEASSRADHRPAALALAVVAVVEFCVLMLYVRARAVEKRRAETAPA